jgi:MFS family permease
MNASIPSLVSSKKLIKINSFTTTASSIAGILSPVIAGIIFGFVPIKLFLIVNGISYLISSVLELKIDFKFNQGENMQENTSSMSFHSVKLDFTEIWDFIKEQKGLLQLLKYLLIINFFFHSLISVIYPFLINHVLHLGSVQYGAFQAFYFVGMIITSVLIGSKKENKNANIGKGIILTGVITFLIGLPSLGIHFLANGFIITIYNMVLIFTMGAALTSINIPVMVAIQRMTPEHIRGRIMGVLGILTAGIAPLGIVLSGLIIDKVHPFILLTVIGVCITLTGLSLSRNKELSFS